MSPPLSDIGNSLAVVLFCVPTVFIETAVSYGLQLDMRLDFTVRMFSSHYDFSKHLLVMHCPPCLITETT